MRKLFNWYYKTASIKKKLVISYLILVLFPIIVLGIYSYHISKTKLIDQTRHTMEGNVSSITYSLENNIRRENDNIKYLSYNARLRERLETGSEDVGGLVKELNVSVEPAFWYFITSDDNLKGIEIFSPYIKRPIGDFLNPLRDSEVQSWYDAHRKDYKTHWVYEDDRIYALRMVLDADTSSKPIGVMKLEVFPENFIASIYTSEFHNNGVILVDREGKIVGKRSISNGYLQKEIEEEIKSGNIETFKEGRGYMLAASEELGNGWRLFYFLDKQEITGEVKQILATTALVAGVCLVLVTVLINFMSRLLSARILKLKNYAEKVSRGEFDVPFNMDYADEIGIVSNSFADMCRKINHMMDETYRLGMEKRAEELKALQAMINPHFLYNCLSSIKWKAIRADQEDIANITGLLARFYRTALNGGEQITIVKNELENIKAYLEIQANSHDNSFDVEYAVSEEGQQLNMPNFLLQPVVENAVCHGVDECKPGVRGYVKIEYYREEQFLIFKVYNNGPSLQPEEINRIKTVPKGGYGIHNIQERIRMYYDDEACGLFGDVTAEGLVCFTIRLKDTMKDAK